MVMMYVPTDELVVSESLLVVVVVGFHIVFVVIVSFNKSFQIVY